MKAPQVEPLLEKTESGGEAGTRVELPTYTAALVNTFKAVFGTGLLGMPFGFVQVGLTYGLAITAVVGVWCVYTMLVISECVKLANDARSQKVSTFGELVTASLGTTAGLLLGTSNLILHQLLCCAAYLVFVSENVAQVFGIGALSVIIAATPPYAMLCCLKDMRLLGPTSASGTAILGCVLVAVLWDGYFGDHGTARPAPGAPTLAAVASFVGVGLFTFAGHTEVVPIVISMGKSAPRFRSIASLLLFVGVPVVAFFSAAAATAFGPRTPQNIILALHGPKGDLLKVMMSVVAFFSLPLKMFPAVTQMERYLLRPDAPFWMRALLCTGLAVSSAVLAATLPDFGFLLAIVGAFCVGIIAFTLPPAMLLALGGARSPLSRAGHVLLLVLGGLVTVVASAKVLQEKLR